MKRLLVLLLLSAVLSGCAFASVGVQKTKAGATGELTESLVVPSGTSITFASGSTLGLSGATVTGFAYSSLTGKPTTLSGFGITDAQPLDSDLTDLADGSLTGSKVGSGISGSNITTGTVPDANIASTIARDSEVTSAISALGSVYQPLDTDLTAFAAKTAPTGAVVGTTDTQTLSGKTISGSSNTLSNIANGSLTNSSITVAGNAVSLGGSVTQDQITGLSATGLVKRTAANTLAAATAGTDYVTPSGSITGNAATATALQTARTIGGVSFDGTANVVPQTVQVVDSTDATSSVALFDSATGNLQPKTDGGLTYNSGTGKLGAGSIQIIGADLLNEDSVHVLSLQNSDTTATEDHLLQLNTHDADRGLSINGNVSFGGSFTTSGSSALTLTTTGTTSVTLPTAGTLATTAGNVATATALQTARTINGVSFNGTANVTVPAAGSTLTDAVTAAKGGTGQTSYTKGNILVATGATTLTKLAVGSNDQILTADSTQASGVKWADAPAGGSGVAESDDPTWTGTHTFSQSTSVAQLILENTEAATSSAVSKDSGRMRYSGHYWGASNTSDYVEPYVSFTSNGPILKWYSQWWDADFLSIWGDADNPRINLGSDKFINLSSTGIQTGTGGNGDIGINTTDGVNINSGGDAAINITYDGIDIAPSGTGDYPHIGFNNGARSFSLATSAGTSAGAWVFNVSGSPVATFDGGVGVRFHDYTAGVLSTDSSGNISAHATKTFTLSSGAATVSDTDITANSVIVVTLKSASGTRSGNPDIVPTASTGFTATGGASDNSTYNYVILN